MLLCLRFSILVIAAVCFGACSSREAVPRGRTRPPPLVAVEAVRPRNVRVEVRAPIDLRPIAQADVGSKTLGYLEAVLVDRGDTVRRGQLLALVRPSDLPAQLNAARGNLAQFEASAILAQSNLERARRLAPAGVVSLQELAQAQAALASAEASQSSSRAQIAAVGMRLSETRIVSPLDGVVSVRRLDPGTLVGPPGGGAIVTVARIDTLRAFVAVNERDAQSVHVGLDAEVTVDALPGRTFTGRVARLAPSFDPVTRTLVAEVHLPNTTGELRPGMYGRALIVTDTHPNRPVVSVDALSISNGHRWVFVLQGSRVHRREVETGVDGGEWFEVLHGLAVGEEVVTAGMDGLSDNTVVRASRNVDPFTGASRAASLSNP